MRRALLALLSTVAGIVLLLSARSVTGSPPATPPAAIANAPATSGARATLGGSAGTATATGPSVSTRYGPVQVQVTMTAGKITDVAAIRLPQDNPRDVEIASYAVPLLRQEALAAQSAQIDMVSGATYTSQGYIASLQSALDQLKG